MGENRRVLGMHDFELVGVGMSIAGGATVILLVLGLWPVAIVTALVAVALLIWSRRLRKRPYEAPTE